MDYKIRPARLKDAEVMVKIQLTYPDRYEGVPPEERPHPEMLNLSEFDHETLIKSMEHGIRYGGRFVLEVNNKIVGFVGLNEFVESCFDPKELGWLPKWKKIMDLVGTCLLPEFRTHELNLALVTSAEEDAIKKKAEYLVYITFGFDKEIKKLADKRGLRLVHKGVDLLNELVEVYMKKLND